MIMQSFSKISFRITTLARQLKIILLLQKYSLKEGVFLQEAGN